jgi:methionyl-tRNA formyltransferase
MNKRDCKIIFLGTPLFAATILQKLIQEQYNIVAVVTAPDKAAGRGMELKQSEVKQCALQHNIPVLQPHKLKNPEFLTLLASYQANMQIVVAFRMLPELVWNMPPLGTINLHASLLPNYRGAAPINWAIINGETISGITTFKLRHEIDTGDILLQEKIDIPANYTAGQLHDEMMHKGANLICTTIDKVLENSITPKLQNYTGNEPHAPKLFTEHCLLDFGKPAQALHNLVRGLSPYPSAYCVINNKKLKVYETNFELASNIACVMGQYETDGKTFLKIACHDGWLYLLQIQAEGKKRMTITDYLRGARL